MESAACFFGFCFLCGWYVGSLIGDVCELLFICWCCRQKKSAPVRASSRISITSRVNIGEVDVGAVSLDGILTKGIRDFVEKHRMKELTDGASRRCLEEVSHALGLPGLTVESFSITDMSKVQ